MKASNHEIARILTVILAATTADRGTQEYAEGCAELSSVLRSVGLPPLAADELTATATIPPAGAPVAPALGHDPLADAVGGAWAARVGADAADAAADDATAALERVAGALRRLALAAAATASVRGDLCGAQWAELADVLREVLGGEPAVAPAPAVVAAVGDGPSVEWFRAQYDAAVAKGDRHLASWYAGQAARHGARFE